MISPLWLGLGVMAAAAVVFYARRGGRARESRVFAVGLAVAAGLYVAFALVGGAGPAWIGVEAAGFAAFALLAWAGHRWSGWILAAGWILHVAWDVGLHLVTARPFVGTWYPNLCITFDLAVAGYVAWRSAFLPTPRS